MSWWLFDRTVARTEGQDCLHPGRERRVQFGDRVGDEDRIRRGQSQFLGDPPITVRLDFMADGGVEITTNVVGQISRRRVGEKQLLRQRANAGGTSSKTSPSNSPAS